MRPALLPALCGLALALTACGIVQPARMEQPTGLEACTRAASIEGLGGGTRGSFRVDGNQGTFTRSAARLALFDELVAFDRGGATFTIQGADFPAPVSAHCEFRQTTSTLRFLHFTPKPFNLECRYDGVPAQFVLQEMQPAAGVRTLQAERAGQWNGTSILTVHSVHTATGSVVPLAAPLGYRIDAQGAPMASVELNGLTPQLRLPADTGQRRDALLIALTLALLWDPATQ